MNPEKQRDEGVGPLSRSRVGGRGITHDPAAAQRRRPTAACRRGQAASATASTTIFEARRQEADEFYAAVIPPSLERRRGQRHAAGAGRHALVQAVLLLRRRPLARGARRRPVQAEAARHPQRPLAPHVQRRHHLDAGQVGIPLVRGLGPGLPRPRADAGGRGLRQGAAGPDAAGALPAPQRPAPRLRVELRRRQPAGARLGDDLHLPAGEGAARARATSTGSSAASTSCCSTSPGG